VICTNCRRDTTTRECADETHRADRYDYLRKNPKAAPVGARGFSRSAVRAGALERRHGAPGQTELGKKLCPECGRSLPHDHFWSTRQRKTTVKCGWCLRKRRMARPARLSKKARWRKDMAETNSFWEAQAAKHP
jgi:hypothetical protein